MENNLQFDEKEELKKLVNELTKQEDVRNFNAKVNNLIINWAKKELEEYKDED